MDADIFLQQFGHLAQSEGGIKKLRDVILQLAVQGKLVAQNPADENAGVILQKSKPERKSKNDQTYLATNDSELYPLPAKWVWTRLGHIAAYGVPQKVNSNDEIAHDTWVLDLEDIEKDTSRLLQRVNAQERIFQSAKTAFQKGDVLFGKLRPYLNKVLVADDNGVCTTEIVPIRAQVVVNPNYIRLVLQSPMTMRAIEKLMYGMKMPRLGTSDANNLPFPLAPLAEQKRIVAKVDELTALCDELEAEQNAQRALKAQAVQSTLHQLTSSETPGAFGSSFNILNRTFGNWFDDLATVKHLRASILQLAVQGKLVPQDSSDEPASELLKRIEVEKKRIKIKVKTAEVTELADLHSLPSTWIWQPLGQLISMMDSGWSPACEQHPASNTNSWGVLKTTAVQVMRYLDFENKALPAKLQPRPEIEVKVGDLLITRAGPRNRVGISCLVEETRQKLMISDKIIRFHLVGALIYERYISLCLNAGETNRYIELAKSGMADSQLNISQDKLKAAPIPLPPLAEQKRIVAKVDELMTLCDQLEAHITQTQTLNTHLMDSLIHRMTEAV